MVLVAMDVRVAAPVVMAAAVALSARQPLVGKGRGLGPGVRL